MHSKNERPRTFLTYESRTCSEYDRPRSLESTSSSNQSFTLILNHLSRLEFSSFLTNYILHSCHSIPSMAAPIVTGGANAGYKGPQPSFRSGVEMSDRRKTFHRSCHDVQNADEPIIPSSSRYKVLIPIGNDHQHMDVLSCQFSHDMGRKLRMPTILVVHPKFRRGPRSEQRSEDAQFRLICKDAVQGEENRIGGLKCERCIHASTHGPA